ncbi:MAG: IclR family transcriptional regulator [Actinomycetes bacterium]
MKGNGNGNGSDATVQSVERAITVLEILARRGEAGVSQVAEELGVHRSTASRLLAVLERRGLAEQLEDRGRYRLGFRLLLLAGAGAGQLDLARLAGPVCERLAAGIGETVNVAVLAGDAAVNVAQARGTASVLSHNWIGQRTPLHSTSSGKVLLAWASPAERDRLMGRPLERFTPLTVTDPEILRRQLDEVTRRGWASAVEELELGMNAVAAPIRGYDSTVVAAISASGPTYRLGPGDLAEVARSVTAGADDISVQLGHAPPEPNAEPSGQGRG